jgi:hypothetical protein
MGWSGRALSNQRRSPLLGQKFYADFVAEAPNDLAAALDRACIGKHRERKCGRRFDRAYAPRAAFPQG